jgi:hypothetical protein
MVPPSPPVASPPPRKLIEIDLERTATGGLSRSASMIAALAAECSHDAGHIEIWRYNEKEHPTFNSVERYVVLENLTPRRLNLPMFAERANTHDSPKLRKYLRGHVFVVKERMDKSRWEPKEFARERLVFLNA